MTLDPGSWISWIIVGLIAGAIAARVVAGRGFGCIADIVVGVAGAIIGGYLLGALFNAGGTVGFWGSIVVAFIGAAVLLSVLKLLSGGRLIRRIPSPSSNRLRLGPRLGRAASLGSGPSLDQERGQRGKAEEGDRHDQG